MREVHITKEEHLQETIIYLAAYIEKLRTGEVTKEGTIKIANAARDRAALSLKKKYQKKYSNQ